MHLCKENDVYKRERPEKYQLLEHITFKQPKEELYIKEPYDWYMTVALEKSDKVTEDRHLLTSSLLHSYRWAIREGYNHMLDPALRNQYDYPRNRNTIKGIESYINRIKRLSEARD